MTFAEHAVAQVLREVAEEIRSVQGHQLTVSPQLTVSMYGLSLVLDRIAQKLSPKPPGEK